MASEERFNGANIVEAGRLSPYWGEHAARYAFAVPYIDGKAVLDIACGTGYGLGFLKQKTRFAVGVDVSLAAARDAQKECGENTFVLLGDGLSLPFADGLFDVVTSFETIEHLHQRRRFLLELKRVLKDRGRLILSTPNALYTRPVNGKPTNPFHIHEYTPEELRCEIGDEFLVENVLGQTLAPEIRISPFYSDQQRLSGGISSRAMLLGWKVMNKMPLAVREGLSEAIWNRPFYPTESDYVFAADVVDAAPVQVVVCRKK